MKTLGAAVIGCGAISKMHLDAIAGLDCAKILYVVDNDAEKAGSAVSQYGGTEQSDYKEMLKDPRVDVVHICTPHYLHAQMSIDSMKSGKHVLTEKPMATHVNDAKAMSDVSKETGKSLGVCFQNRYNPTSVILKSILESGKTGRIIGAKAAVTWHRDEDYYTQSGWRGSWEKEGGGVLINQAIHTLDLLQWFIGDIESIRGSYFTSLLDNAIEVEDTANAVIRFKNSVSALFYATNCYQSNSPVSMELLCSGATIRLEGDLTINYNDGGIEHYSDDDMMTGEKSYWGASHKRLIADFYKKLLSGEKFAIDGNEGIKALQMVKAIHQSSDEKIWKEL